VESGFIDTYYIEVCSTRKTSYFFYFFFVFLKKKMIFLGGE